ncbi:hypothetical protein PPL_06881 [Heterostelium album PN500]|uniref:Uncharacterized protein n=1 Tax=Heterostelium pallidum (strain ATCC 26659 / Pp 5 / PN500) TaxID=670386 RepID=D3BDS8_HETP5|nr:hypothetical protein PPL_06881 [Heterostelium album PN500]EFA80059.1 hypothetical protein PPL_06881 [Heterostelium album PN500]|eukprot:XP_020432179.1 hypothetical protein PPL_06881 [Heterostelium album PN500]
MIRVLMVSTGDVTIAATRPAAIEAAVCAARPSPATYP